jgi:hypothetical protein
LKQIPAGYPINYRRHFRTTVQKNELYQQKHNVWQIVEDFFPQVEIGGRTAAARPFFATRKYTSLSPLRSGLVIARFPSVPLTAL